MESARISAPVVAVGYDKLRRERLRGSTRWVERTAWFPWMRCRRSESRHPRSLPSSVALLAARSRLSRALGQTNFTERYSTTCATTFWMQTIGLAITTDYQSPRHDRMTLVESSEVPLLRTKPSSSFPMRAFGSASHVPRPQWFRP